MILGLLYSINQINLRKEKFLLLQKGNLFFIFFYQGVISCTITPECPSCYLIESVPNTFP